MRKDIHDVVQRLGQAEAAGDMGRDDHVGLCPQGMLRRQRLGVRHVQPCTGELPAVHRRRQCLAVHSSAPSHIEQDGTGLAERHPPGVEQMPCLRRVRQAQRHKVGLRQLCVQFALRHHTGAVVRAGGVRVHGAAHTHHLGSQRMSPPGKVRADIAHAHAQHPAARDAAHRVAGGRPAVLPLVIPVGGQLLEQAEPQRQHTLADGQPVSAGGVGHDAALRQHPRLQIVIRAGCVGLEPLQMIVLPDQRHRQVAQHRISPQGILHRGSIRGGKAICKALHRLNAGSLLCTDGQADKDMFRHNRVSFPLFVYHTANCAAVQGAVLLFSAAPYKRTMPDSPKAARHRIIFQSSARIASTVRLYCSATFANCSCVPSSCPARRVSVRV